MNNFFYGEVPFWIFIGVCVSCIFLFLSYMFGVHVGYGKGFKDAMRDIRDEMNDEMHHEQ